MAPDYNGNVNYFWSESCRHSPRIYNRSTVKFDVSAVNNKLSFMRSLNLSCTKSTISHPEIDWEIRRPRNSLPLKECSVLMNDVRCEVCGVMFKNQMDIDNHRNIHSRFMMESDESKENQEGPIVRKDHYSRSETVKVNVLKAKDEFECNQKSRRKRSKDAVTKVTLKIGGEVISKVFCKTKYLNNTRSKKRKVPKVHQKDSCTDCNKIEDILHNNSNVTVDSTKLPCHVEKSCTDDCNRIARLRKIAAALVEFELQQKILQNSQSDVDDSEGDFIENQDEDDAVVPNISSLDDIDRFEDDDIQEVLRITRNDHSIMNKPVDHQISPKSLRRKSQVTLTDYEIITIDDNYCENFEDDCMIIDERLSERIDLKETEESYSIKIFKKDDVIPQYLDDENSKVIVVNSRSIPTEPCDMRNEIKKGRIDRATIPSDDCNHNTVLDHNWNKSPEKNQKPTIEFSQFAVPFHLINF